MEEAHVRHWLAQSRSSFHLKCPINQSESWREWLHSSLESCAEAVGSNPKVTEGLNGQKYADTCVLLFSGCLIFPRLRPHFWIGGFQTKTSRRAAFNLLIFTLRPPKNGSTCRSPFTYLHRKQRIGRFICRKYNRGRRVIARILRMETVVVLKYWLWLTSMNNKFIRDSNSCSINGSCVVM